MGDSNLSASELRQRYNRGGTASDAERSNASIYYYNICVICT